MGTTSRSCSLNFPSCTFSVHSWGAGAARRGQRPRLGTLGPTALTARADLRPELGPRRPVLLWPGSQNPPARCGVPASHSRRGRSGHTRTLGFWGWRPPGPASGPWGKPAHTEGPQAPTSCLGTRGCPAPPRGTPRTDGANGPAPGSPLETGFATGAPAWSAASLTPRKGVTEGPGEGLVQANPTRQGPEPGVGVGRGGRPHGSQHTSVP